jgi:hypothetical protein
MAELDPEKVGTSGFDPGTGSPLSQEVRNALLKKSTIDRSIFRNELLESENRKREIDTQNVIVIQSQEQALLGFNSNIQALRNDIGKLGVGLSNIALLLRQDNAEETERIKIQQEKERRLVEQRVRIGRESEIEQKIQSALVAPVQRLVPQVNDVFGRIGAALGILFGGWLTNQVVQAIKASEEGNTKLFNDIRFNIIKNLAIVGGGLFAIRAGFSLVKKTIGQVAMGLTRLLIAKPLALAGGLLRNVPGFGPKATTPPRQTGPRQTGPKFGMFGSIFNAFDAFLNFRNQEYADGLMRSVMLVLPAVGPLGVVKGLLGLGVAADQIAEVFGSNLFGKNPNMQKISESAKSESQKTKTTTLSKPTSSPISSYEEPQTSPKTTPTVQPQTTMMGESIKPAPSAERVSQFEQAWQYRNNPLARGRIESAWNSMSSEEKQQAKDWAKSKGYDWNEMKLSDPSSMMSQATPMAQTTKESVVPAQMTPSAEMTAPPKEPVKVGQLPEPNPSVTMIKTSSSMNQQSNIPITSGALTDVPLINSANPDNFYVLYSQLNYNVVT